MRRGGEFAGGEHENFSAARMRLLARLSGEFHGSRDENSVAVRRRIWFIRGGGWEKSEVGSVFKSGMKRKIGQNREA